eukprot:1311591-Amphidinium_carterae.1
MQVTAQEVSRGVQAIFKKAMHCSKLSELVGKCSRDQVGQRRRGSHRPTTPWAMKKALYGLRTSPKQSQEHLSTIMKEMGFNSLGR